MSDTRFTEPPHDYLTQDLANGKVRLFAVEEVVDDANEECHETLRAVATVEADTGRDLASFLAATAAAVTEFGEILERLRQQVRRPSAAAAMSPERALALALHVDVGRPGTSLLIGRLPTLPNAVAVAVTDELRRLGVPDDVLREPPPLPSPLTGEQPAQAIARAVQLSTDPGELIEAFDVLVAAQLGLLDDEDDDGRWDHWYGPFLDHVDRAGVDVGLPAALPEFGYTSSDAYDRMYAQPTLLDALWLHELVQRRLHRWAAADRIPDRRGCADLLAGLPSDVRADPDALEAIAARVEAYIRARGGTPPDRDSWVDRPVAADMPLDEPPEPERRTSYTAAVAAARELAAPVVQAAEAAGWTVTVANRLGDIGGEQQRGDTAEWALEIICAHPRDPFAVHVWVDVADAPDPGRPQAEVYLTEVNVTTAPTGPHGGRTAATPEMFSSDDWPQPLLTGPDLDTALAMLGAHADGIDPQLLDTWAAALEADTRRPEAAAVRALAERTRARRAHAAAGWVLEDARARLARAESAVAATRSELAALEADPGPVSPDRLRA